MLRFLNLHGSLAGFVILDERDDGTAVELRLRGRPLQHTDSMIGFVSDGMAEERIGLAALKGRTHMKNVKALVLDDGRSYACEKSGNDPKEAEQLLNRLRLTAAGAAVTAERTGPSEIQANGAEPPAEPPPMIRSPVTHRIVSEANELFGMPTKNRAPDAEDGAEETKESVSIPPGPQPIEREADPARPAWNPFPRRFPGSVWHKAPDDSLEGTVKLRGRIFSARAVRIGRARQPMGIPRTGGVFAVSENGERFFITFRPLDPRGTLKTKDDNNKNSSAGS